MRYLVIMFLIVSWSVSAAANRNFLLNPGFENSSSWIIPKYWGGELKIISPGYWGKSCGELKATTHGKEYFGRCYQLPVIEPAWGRLFSYTMQVKGCGELFLGVLQYTQDDKGKINTDIIYSKPFILNENEWQTVKMDILLTPYRLVRFAPMVEVRGDNAVAYLDDGKLVVASEPGVALSASPAHLIIEEGASPPNISFQLTQNNEPLPEAVLKVLNGDQLLDAKCDKNGKFMVKSAGKGARVAVSATKYGTACEVFIDRMAPDAWKTSDSIARDIKLKRKLSILYLGDSLTDFQRGYNYVDKVNFWLERYNPGLVTFRNAGVRGDYITRVEKRMMDGKSYQQEKYEDLFGMEYDYIFIFLGHNDTRCLSNKNYQEPLVAPVVQETAYRQVIKHIQENSKARIVLVSSTSSNFEVCQQNINKLKTQNKPHSLFGQPDKLEAFNAVLEKLAKEEKLLYLDVYTPTKNAMDKASFFSATDGVHLTEEGNRFLANIFLQFLKEQIK